MRTSYDDKDYLTPLEVYYYDADGEECVDEALTDLAIGSAVTCADMGEESLLAIKLQLARAFTKRGIPFTKIEVEPPG